MATEVWQNTDLLNSVQPKLKVYVSPLIIILNKSIEIVTLKKKQKKTKMTFSLFYSISYLNYVHYLVFEIFMGRVKRCCDKFTKPFFKLHVM